MEPELQNVMGIAAAATTVVAAMLGYISERSILGVLMLGGFTAVACGLCYAGFMVGGWVGLLVAIAAVTFLAHRVGSGFGRGRGGMLVPALWLGFCASCAIGYWAGGWVGLLTITLPSLLVFWWALFGISGCLLPLHDRSQRGKAFRSLLTYNLGTNHPYHVLEDRDLVERVSGNPYGQFFAGPGIVLTGPAHAPIVWDGLKFKRIGEPGLTFTGRFETIYQTVDLRPQLRSFFIEAITKDGIRVRVLTFMPFQLDPKKQKPGLGTSFPMDEESVYKAIRQQPVEQGQRRSWDEIVPMTATRIMRRIISGYRLDQLCEPFDPDRDPRVKIKDDLVKILRQQMRGYGIHLIGGGISNLTPVDGNIVQERTRAWRAEWERKITEKRGEGRARALLEVERAHAKAQAEMISRIRQVIEECGNVDPTVVADMATLRFIEALEEMAGQPQVQGALPPEDAETLLYLRRVLGSGQPG